jgi:hypothetical protein
MIVTFEEFVRFEFLVQFFELFDTVFRNTIRNILHILVDKSIAMCVMFVLRK